jgi:hypothetical protein
VSYVTEKRFLPSHNASLTGKRPAGGKYAGSSREEGSRVKLDVYWPSRFGSCAIGRVLSARSYKIRQPCHFCFHNFVLAVTGVGFMLRGLRLRDREE